MASNALPPEVVDMILEKYSMQRLFDSDDSCYVQGLLVMRDVGRGWRIAVDRWLSRRMERQLIHFWDLILTGICVTPGPLASQVAEYLSDPSMYFLRMFGLGDRPSWVETHHLYFWELIYYRFLVPPSEAMAGQMTEYLSDPPSYFLKRFAEEGRPSGMVVPK